MTSEYMHTYDASLDDEFGEKTVSILLDGEESEMIFIDHPASEMSVSGSRRTAVRLTHFRLRSTGGKLAVDLRAARLHHRVLHRAEELFQMRRGDIKLLVARERHKGQGCNRCREQG